MAVKSKKKVAQKQYKVRISSWEEFYCLASWCLNESATWVFRGHEDATWKLESTWDRFVAAYKRDATGKTFKIGSSDVNEALAGYFRFFQEENAEILRKEKIMIDEFKRIISFDHYLGQEKLPYLMMMQHYGIPTRLLDFSYSLFVALYFAYENTERPEREDEPERAIWAIKLDGIRDWLFKNCKTDIKNGKMRECNYSELVDKLLSAKYKCGVSKGVVPILYATNPRMVAQKGLFLMSFTKESYTDGFCDNLQYVLKCNPSVLFDKPQAKHWHLKDYIALRDRSLSDTLDFEEEARNLVKIEEERGSATARNEISLCEFLAIKDKSDIHVLKFVFAKDMRAKARAVLEQANIDEMSIYPDVGVDVNKLKRISRNLKYRFISNLC